MQKQNHAVSVENIVYGFSESLQYLHAFHKCRTGSRLMHASVDIGKLPVDHLRCSPLPKLSASIHACQTVTCFQLILAWHQSHSYGLCASSPTVLFERICSLWLLGQSTHSSVNSINLFDFESSWCKLFL